MLNTNLFALLMSGVPVCIFATGALAFFFVYADYILIHKELLLILLLILFPCIPLYLISKSAHILVSDNKHKIKVYALNPEWLMRQLAESGT